MQRKFDRYFRCFGEFLVRKERLQKSPKDVLREYGIETGNAQIDVRDTQVVPPLSESDWKNTYGIDMDLSQGEPNLSFDLHYQQWQQMLSGGRALLLIPFEPVPTSLMPYEELNELGDDALELVAGGAKEDKKKDEKEDPDTVAAYCCCCCCCNVGECYGNEQDTKVEV